MMSDLVLPKLPSAMERTIQTTVALDDDLVAEAQRLTDLTKKLALPRKALHAPIERQSTRRLTGRAEASQHYGRLRDSARRRGRNDEAS